MLFTPSRSQSHTEALRECFGVVSWLRVVDTPVRLKNAQKG